MIHEDVNCGTYSWDNFKQNCQHDKMSESVYCSFVATTLKKNYVITVRLDGNIY